MLPKIPRIALPSSPTFALKILLRFYCEHKNNLGRPVQINIRHPPPQCLEKFRPPKDPEGPRGTPKDSEGPRGTPSARRIWEIPGCSRVSQVSSSFPKTRLVPTRPDSTRLDPTRSDSTQMNFGISSGH